MPTRRIEVDARQWTLIEPPSRFFVFALFHYFLDIWKIWNRNWRFQRKKGFGQYWENLRSNPLKLISTIRFIDRVLSRDRIIDNAITRATSVESRPSGLIVITAKRKKDRGATFRNFRNCQRPSQPSIALCVEIYCWLYVLGHLLIFSINSVFSSAFIFQLLYWKSVMSFASCYGQ